MSGTINCNQEGTVISRKTGSCPKCGNAKCHIRVYWREQTWRYYKDTNGIVFSFMTALDQLAAMNREIRHKTFKPEMWQAGAIKERKLKFTATQWLIQRKKEVDRDELSYGTYHSYRSHIETHILNPDYGLGGWDVRDISYEELEMFKDNLPDHLKIKTRREIMHTLHNFLKWALRKHKGLMPEFPIVKGNDSRQTFALTIEQQYDALKKIPEEHRDFFEFEFEMGTRPGETCALKIKDVDLKDKTVLIHRTFTIRKLRESDKEGHRKTLPLTERAIAIIKRHVSGRFPEDWLFLHPLTKDHYTVHRTALIWNKYTQLPVTHYEGTRHSHATQAAELNDLQTAQALLRHKDVRSTLRYVHNRIDYLREAQKKRSNVVDIHKEAKK